MSQALQLPEEIVQEILLRLPLKSLVRCMSLRTSLQSLIKSSSFITAHSKLHRSNRSLFLIQNGSYFILSHPRDIQPRKTTIPFEAEAPFCFITSFNGLFCINFRVSYSRRHVFLWNPSIARFKYVDELDYALSFTDYNMPRGPSNNDLSNYYYALGFDELDNTYKVVKIYYGSQDTEVNVYHLSTDTWHTVDYVGDVARIEFPWRNAHVNGAIHWLAYFGDDAKADDQSDVLSFHFKSTAPNEYLAILSFDFNSEVFGQLSLPNTTKSPGDKSEEDLKVMKGMLAFVVTSKLFVSDQLICSVWLMKEYGVSESWMKAYTVVPVTRFHSPLGFTNNGELVFYSHHGTRLLSYDLNNYNKNSSSGEAGFETSFPSEVFFDYMENLTLLDSGSASLQEALQHYYQSKNVKEPEEISNDVYIDNMDSLPHFCLVSKSCLVAYSFF